MFHERCMCHADISYCEEKCDRDQGDSKFRNKNGDSSDRDNRKKHYELKHGSRDDDKHHKNKQRTYAGQ